MNTKLSIVAIPLLASLVAQCGYFNSNNNSPTKPPPGIIAREHQFKRENVKSNSELIAAEGQENKQSQSDALNPITEIKQRETSVSQVEEQIIENAPRRDTPVKIVQKPQEIVRAVVNVNVEECVNSWNNWKKTYTATNPIASMNKTSQYKTDERQMQKIAIWLL